MLNKSAILYSATDSGELKSLSQTFSLPAEIYFGDRNRFLKCRLYFLHECLLKLNFLKSPIDRPIQL